MVPFAGNAEGRDIMSGEFDVIVTDGFTGNVVLKFWRRSCQPVFRIIEKIGGKRWSSGKAGGLSPETGIEKISCEAAGLCRIWRSAFDGD